MDAREQLRRYLDQRREMGESELVLDRMTVDEAMRLLGGSGSGAPPKPGAPISPSATSDPPADPNDWRAILRAADASIETPKGGPVTAPGATSADDTSFAAPTTKSAEPPAPPIVSVAPGISVGTPSSELFGGQMAALDSLETLVSHVAACTRCPLHSTATNPVPGEGNPNADFMCVGEAPGATEDQTGRPFVGAAGQLLTKILAAIDFKREDVYICNVLKHRPPGNRNPLPDEVKACSPYLIRQIELIRPKVILALGTFAAQTLLNTTLSIGKLRGQVHRYYGVPLVVTYHPAALLRNPGWKRPTWEDVQLARRILDSSSTRADA
ncbi:MAG TPA: uracil-DNA glycosylase family protein [Gemmatimonadaceae bacterium]